MSENHKTKVPVFTGSFTFIPDFSAKINWDIKIQKMNINENELVRISMERLPTAEKTHE